MKIAIIVRKLNIKGGTQRQAVCLARELKKMGHKVKFYTFIYSQDCYEDILKNFEIVCLSGHKTHPNYFINLFFENKNSKKLASLIDKDTDILNPHDQVSYKVAAYFKKRIKKIPSAWMMNDMPTKTWSFWRDSQFDPDLKASFLKKFVYWLVDFYDYFKFIRHQDEIIVLDNRDRGWVKKYFKKDAVVIRSGLDLESNSYIERGSLQGKKVKLLMNGIFFPHRRFEDGILAVKILKDKNQDVELVITGDHKNNQKYYKKLVDLVDGLGLGGDVSFAGKVSDEEFKNYYEEGSIFIFPNHLQSWGLVVFEAIARGLPVIVSKTAGASEVLTDHENSILVEPKSPEEIAAAVEELVDNPDLYKKLSKEGRRFVEKNISWEKCAKRMLEIFSNP